MNYTLAYSFCADAGLAPVPKLLRPAGDEVQGAEALNSFTRGVWYAFTMSIPGSFQGFLAFEDPVAGTLALFAVNPQEGEFLDTRVSLAGSGTGARPTKISVRDSNNQPIAGVAVWVSSDAAGADMVAGTLRTDDMGLATFVLDPGSYWVWRQHPSVQFTNPQPLTV
jgi:hypothetical protein